MRCLKPALLLGAVVLGGLSTTVPAQAVSGGAPAVDGAYAFAAKLTSSGRACSGVLVAPNWVLTTASCFPGTADGGAPATAVTAIVGRTDLNGTSGHQTTVSAVAVRGDRDLALAKLADAVTDVEPAALATAPPAAGEKLRVAGFGRTATEWVPSRLHTATFAVTSAAATTTALAGDGGADTCKGDAGGPVVRESGGRVELAAISSASWQHGCLGETETRQGTTAVRVDDVAGWIGQITRVTDVSLTGGRIARLQNGSAYLLDDVNDRAWSLLWDARSGAVTKLRAECARTGVLLANGDLWVKDDNVPALGWVPESDAVTDFALSGDRVAAVRAGSAYLKEGNLQGSWTTEWDARSGAVTAVGVDGARVGVLTADQHLRVRDDAAHSPWTDQADRVTGFDLSGSRIAVLRDGFALLKDGDLFGGWSTQWDPQDGAVTKVDIDGARIGLLLANGVVQVKDDQSANTSWFAEADRTTAFGITGPRIAVVRDGRISVKDGNLQGPWTELSQ
ncbi:S1 family peptidase [Amycolatopsis sp. NPDC049159]|uniref:S1 family peptidase n=1 Tax=Amycolatopsis sp. NPDC049159 TaxID=3157210 RepID=UPI0033E527C2